MKTEITPVILSGGIGTRLWPLSRKNYPKQFLKLTGKHSLFQETLLRMQQMTSARESLILTNESHYFLCRDQMKEIGVDNGRMILEPCSRNTAPAIALAAKEIAEEKGKKALMLILPADHLIGNTELFVSTIESAIVIAERGLFVTFGITPTSPKTGYGYIQAGRGLDPLGFKVEKFVEKPTREIAETFLAAKNYFWNSGMFLFQAKAYLEELEWVSHPIYEAVTHSYSTGERNRDYVRIDEESFGKCPNISIDYAVMEKTDRAVVVPLTLPWNDLGCWASIADAGKADKKNNVIRGNVIERACTGCLLSSEDASLLATIGLENQIVVSTADAVLVADKAYAQEVKEIVSALKMTNQTLVNEHKKASTSWGCYENLVDKPDLQIRYLVINSTAQFSLQSHLFLLVIRGKIEIHSNGQTALLQENISQYIPRESTLLNTGKGAAHLLEIRSECAANRTL